MYRKPIRTRQIDTTLWDEHPAKKFCELGWPHLSPWPVRDGCMGAEVNNKLTIRFIWVKMRLKLCRTTRSLGKKVFRKCLSRHNVQEIGTVKGMDFFRSGFILYLTVELAEGFHLA